MKRREANKGGIRAELALFFGIGRNTTPHREKWLSGIGGGFAIATLMLIGLFARRALAESTDATALPFVIASMAASAVLLFAIPHGALSQPWPLLGGHVTSAIIGVWCSLHIDDIVIAGGVATGLSITVMYYLRCMHPPGGATALSAVLREELVERIGYEYVLFPVLTGAVSMLLIAVLFNVGLKWRRYPVHLFFKLNPPSLPAVMTTAPVLSQEDFFAAIQAHGSFVDVTAEGLTELLELAQQHARSEAQKPDRFLAGKFYSNGALGYAWSVREVVSLGVVATDTREPTLHYWVVAGAKADITGECTVEEFREWVQYEVTQHGNLWRKVE